MSGVRLNVGASEKAPRFMENPYYNVSASEISLLVPDTSYETTLKANRRTAEYRMSKGGIATLGLFYKIDRIHYSMFDVQCSMFDVH